MRCFKSAILILTLAVSMQLPRAYGATYTVGSCDNYTALMAAIDAIKVGIITGATTLHIISSTKETAAAVLNESGTYSSVKIYPAGSGYRISDNLASAFIDLNGDNKLIQDAIQNYILI